MKIWRIKINVLPLQSLLRTKRRAFSSAGLEHLPYKQRVGGSNPSAPTQKQISLSTSKARFFALKRDGESSYSVRLSTLNHIVFRCPSCFNRHSSPLHSPIISIRLNHHLLYSGWYTMVDGQPFGNAMADVGARNIV